LKISIQKKIRCNSAFALFIAMIAIFVLSIMAATFAYSMKIETRLAMRSSKEPQLIRLGKSGVQLASWVLAQEASVPNQPYDSLNEIWAGGPGGIGESNSVLAGFSMDNYQVGNGVVSVKIVDLDRYANINTASAAELQQALTLMGVDADDMAVIVDSIQDWVQPGDNPRIAGAKNDYYQSLPVPYNCKEAPIDDMSELLLVRGIRDHPEIFWGGSSTNQNGFAFQHKLGLGSSPGQPVDYPFGLTNLFTPFSAGRININTADANVLQLLPGVDANIAAAILQIRAGPDGVDGTADDTPFKSVNDLTMAGINSTLVAELNRYATVRSSVFQATVTARVGDDEKIFKAILYRTGRNVETVGFYVEK
jgi:type II secretory pathway component PulK